MRSVATFPTALVVSKDISCLRAYPKSGDLLALLTSIVDSDEPAGYKVQLVIALALASLQKEFAWFECVERKAALKIVPFGLGHPWFQLQDGSVKGLKMA